MYLPNSFRKTEIEGLHNFIQENNFAVVITANNNIPEASHLPLLIDPARGKFGTLTGHLARANPMWHDFEAGKETLIIFQGPHTYISPAWYQEQPSVPTWNYTVVHAYGKPQIIEDPQKLEAILKKLVEKHEAGFEVPWKMDLPEDYLQKMLRAIVGFEMEISRLEGKFKLSQNRPEIDQKLVARRLEKSPFPGDTAVARMMDQLNEGK